MNKIKTCLLVALFVGGCQCRDQRRLDCTELCLTVLSRTADSVVFEWTSPKPVEKVSLICGVQQDPYSNTAGMVQIPASGGTSGKISLKLEPHMVYDCKVRVVSPWQIVSNTVQVKAAP